MYTIIANLSQDAWDFIDWSLDAQYALEEAAAHSGCDPLEILIAREEQDNFETI